MSCFCRSGLVPLVLFLPLVPLVAQEHPHHGGEKLGRVEFPISCNPEARQRFERAMAVLHSFWWEEGENAFRAVLASDSTCAMGWWGLAMNAWNNPFGGGPGRAGLKAGQEAAARARAMGGRTPREAGFIAAVEALYRDAATSPNAVRLRAYSDTLARVHRDHPDDEEAAIYYALSLVATASPTDTTFARQKQAAAILNPLFQRHPDHPGLAHYIIHANDSPQLAHLGLDAARRYAEIAPQVPHAQHMPTHIFVRLGMWEETIASNWKAYQAGVAFAKASGQSRLRAHELHAVDYAVYGYLQQGKDSAARSAVALADTVGRTAEMDTPAVEYNRVAMAARIPLELGDWKAAARFESHGPSTVAASAAQVPFTRGIGAARSGDPPRARAEVARLDSLAKALADREPYWSRVADIKRQVVEAWVRLAAGDTAGGLSAAKAAADMEAVTGKHPVTPGELLPARELEGDMLLAAGRFAEAGQAYRASLRREPGRARSLYGAARAAELAGDAAEATARYREYLKLMEKGDGGRAELAHAKSYLAGVSR